MARKNMTERKEKFLGYYLLMAGLVLLLLLGVMLLIVGVQNGSVPPIPLWDKRIA